MPILATLFGSFKWQIIAGIAVAIIVGAMYFYWTYSQNKIAELTAKNVVLQGVVDTQNQTISKLRTSITDAQKDLNDLNKKYADINKKSVADRNAVSLPKVNKANKKQIEKSINNATNTAFRDINNNTQLETF